MVYAETESVIVVQRRLHEDFSARWDAAKSLGCALMQLFKKQGSVLEWKTVWASSVRPSENMEALRVGMQCSTS